MYLPQETHIGISQKIEDEAEREMLRQKLQQLLPKDEHGGFIIRTMAEQAVEHELQADIEYLRKLWADIQQHAKTAPLKTLLYQELNLSLRVLRDFANDETDRILVDSRETYLKMLNFAENYSGGVVDKLNHYAAERPLFDLYAIEDEIEKAIREIRTAIEEDRFSGWAENFRRRHVAATS